MDEEDVVLHILNNLPPEYDSMIESVTTDLDKGSLTLATLRDCLRSRYG